MKSFEYEPIGIIESPFEQIEGMPVQAAFAPDTRGTVTIDQRFAEGLADIDGFSHLVLLYPFHRTGTVELTVMPFLDRTPRGLFATRAPSRPCAIGITVVRLLARRANVLEVAEIDVLNGTPLFDVKPYVPAFDTRNNARIGWLEAALQKPANVRADNRFAD
jgi:tRNA (adenine37-N6)-methyltransferase